jgi:hypothetical protein
MIINPFVPVVTAPRDLMAVREVHFPGPRLSGDISIILRYLATRMSSIMIIEVKKHFNIEGFELYFRGRDHFEVSGARSLLLGHPVAIHSARSRDLFARVCVCVCVVVLSEIARWQHMLVPIGIAVKHLQVTI